MHGGPPQLPRIAKHGAFLFSEASTLMVTQRWSRISTTCPSGHSGRPQLRVFVIVTWAGLTTDLGECRSKCSWHAPHQGG